MSTVLVVEDDNVFRYAACHYLRAEGYTVIDVRSSMDALKILDKGDGFDIVIADIALYPKEPTGFALARMIRFKNPNIRVLFVTGDLDILKKEPGMDGEVVLYKPIDLPELSGKVTEMLAQGDR